MEFKITSFLILIIFLGIVISCIIYTHMGKNFISIILFIILAIPIPLSLLSIPFSFISGIGELQLIGKSTWLETIKSLLFLLLMLLTGTYSISYIFVLKETLILKKLTQLIIIPVAHISLCFLLYYCVEWLEKIIKIR